MSCYQQSWGRGGFNEVDCNRYEASQVNRAFSNEDVTGQTRPPLVIVPLFKTSYILGLLKLFRPLAI